MIGLKEKEVDGEKNGREREKGWKEDKCGIYDVMDRNRMGNEMKVGKYELEEEE